MIAVLRNVSVKSDLSNWQNCTCNKSAAKAGSLGIVRGKTVGESE